VVLFMDSDEPDANAMVPDVEAAGGAVVQWQGDVSIEEAVCSQLDEQGLNAYVQAALEVADDPEASAQSFSSQMSDWGEKNGKQLVEGRGLLRFDGWAAAGLSLQDFKAAVGSVSKKKGWFKRVDKGRRLGQFIRETLQLNTGSVEGTLQELRAAIYTRNAPEIPIDSPEGHSQEGLADG